MACAARGSIMGVSWNSGAVPVAPCPCPIFAANDNGDIDYRSTAAAAARLWRDCGADALQIAAERAQSAFWQGRLATCRWWHSVARMLDRALVARYCLTTPGDDHSAAAMGHHVPANG